MWKIICVIFLLSQKTINCSSDYEGFETVEELSTTKSEIDYTEGLPLSLFDDNQNILTNNNVTDKDGRVTMVIPKKIKEIDARKMKNIRNIRADMNFTDANNPFHFNYVSLSHKLNIYDTEMLIAKFDSIKLFINTQCRDDLEEFIEGLRDSASWALKMDDSNGRYTSGFFWGNNYWTGSQTQCLNIVPESARTPQGSNPFKTTVVSIISDIIHAQNYTGIINAATVSPISSNQNDRSRRDASLTETKKSKISPSLTVGYQHGKLQHESLPNFIPSYFALRLILNSTQDVTPRLRIIQLGLCLPISCTDNEVKMIVETVSSDVKQSEIVVAEVRSQQQYYNMFQDKVFWILVFVSIIVGSLLLAGTVYDYHLINQANKKKMLNLNCTTYDLTQAEHQLEKHITLEIGKSGRYVVNERFPESDESSRENFNINTCTPHVLTEILLAFSIRANLKTICDQSVGSDTIPTIHGLRAISMAWVILGHTCIIIFKYSDNMEYRKLAEQEFLFQTISNGVYSVDTFFFISGLLVSFLYLRTNAKGKLDDFTKGVSKFWTGVLHFIGLITYRFARLTTPYLFILGVVQICMKWHNYNSVFEPPTMDHINCPEYWWRNVLYINTLYPVEEMCMLWSWYLADDTQFYIIGIICLIIGISNAKAATSMMIFFIISSWATTSYVAFVNKHVPNLDDPLALFDLIYDKPWTRLGPYLIGMGTGYFLFKTECRITMSKLTVCVGWLLSSSCLLCLIYGFHEVEFSSYTAAAFSALSHSVWAFGLSWIVIACTTGYGGWVNKILSATILYPFSRVTYCAYLVHPLCIRYLIMQMDSPLHLGKDLIAVIFLGQVVLSYILSFVLSLSFEAPIVSMLRILSPNKTKKLR